MALVQPQGSPTWKRTMGDIEQQPLQIHEMAVTTLSMSHLPVLEDEKLEEIQNILIRHESNEALTTIISAFYGKLLVVMGIAFPIIEALSPETFVTRFNGFYLYLNLGSIIFMLYTYVLLLREEAQANIVYGSHNKPPPTKNVRYGSNYLRVGVAGFGIGSMIFSGLEFGRYFEMNKDSDCFTLLIAISPLARIIFVLMQMLYVFSNNKIVGNNRIYKLIAKFGLMHMIATNLCEWLYVLVEETKQDILKAQRNLNPVLVESNMTENETEEEPCWNSNIMTSLIHHASPYLFPCSVEYSLLCAVILGVMWSNFVKADSNDVMSRTNTKGRCHNDKSFMLFNDRQSGVNVIYCKSVSKFSVDCNNSHKGLFSGILVFVLTIISLIMFFELIQQNIEVAVLQVNLWETALFGSAIGATIAAAIILRQVGFRRRKRRLELEHILLLVTQCGVFLYFLFQIFGGYYYLQEDDYSDKWRLIRMVAPILALVQSSCQTILVLDAWRRRCNTPTQIRQKPGRELITFLLIANLALWIVNRLKNNSAEFHPMQMEFYGIWGWTVITHVSMPLMVCYRFQSTVCLYEIWKHVYKTERRGYEA